MTVRAATLGVVIFGLFAFAYIWASPSLARQHWDSLAYARACEIRGMGGMWGNHPLGHAVQCGVVKVSWRLGSPGRALPVLKLFNGVTAAAAVVALFGVMTTMLGTGLLRAAGWAVVFGGTYGVWHYAGTADIYSLSMLLLIVGFGLAVWSFDRPSPGRCLLAGVAFGAATLSHQFGGVVLLAGTIGLLQLPRGLGWRRVMAGLGILSPGLTRYYSDGRLAVVGVTRQQVFDFFNQYGREGPFFEYQETDGGDVRPVYRLVGHAK